MKKQIAIVVLGLALVSGAIAYVATPEQPHHYELHTVQYGETMEGIIKDANHRSSINYDIRDAVSIAVSKSEGLDNGATSRQLQVGDKVAVPIYR